MAIRQRLVGSIIAATALASPWISQRASADDAKSDDDANDVNSRNTVRKSAVGTLCEPITGTGKSAGVPIAVEDSNGQLITDITGITFELDNGSGTTHDVTQHITTPAEQPIVRGAVANQFGGITEPGLDDLIIQTSMPSGQVQSLIASALSNPGYFFLGCTPDGTNASVKFASGMTLKAIRNGTVIAAGSVAGRSASYLGLVSNNTTNPSQAIRPATGDHTSMDTLYQKYLEVVPVHFKSLFAHNAILQLSNATYGSGGSIWRCWDDLYVLNGSTWEWTATGTSYFNELTSTGAVSWPILGSRTKGQGVSDPNIAVACNISAGVIEDDVFINYLAAQLLLIDAPAGRVPDSVSGASTTPQSGANDTFLRPAVLLVATNPAANTNTTSTTVAVTTTTVSPRTTSTLPATGSQHGVLQLLGGATAAFGIATLVVRRRLRW